MKITSPEKKSFRLPLRLILIVPFLVQIFALVGLTGYLSLRNGQKAVNDLASQMRSNATNNIDRHLDSYLSIPTKLNQINLQAVRLSLLKLNDFERTEKYFWAQMQEFDVGYVNYANTEGEFIGVERLEDNTFAIHEVLKPNILGLTSYATNSKGERTTSEYEADSGDTREEGWYADAARTRRPVWSEIYQWQDKPEILSISSSYPVFDSEEKFIGVIGVDLILSQIGDFLHQLDISPSTIIYIIERDGSLVAGSGTDLPYRMVAGEPQRIQTADSSNSVIKATTQNLLREYQSLDKINQALQTEFFLDGERQFVQVAPWQDELGLDWLIVITMPESDFMAQINANTRTTIILCLGALGVAIVLGWYTSRWITRPIYLLSEAAEAVAQGDLDRQVVISGAKEIVFLSRSFNKMAQKLKSQFSFLENVNKELELRVEERTIELRAAKEAAEIANQTKDRVLTNISQELRTPLKGILGYSRISQRSLSEIKLDELNNFDWQEIKYSQLNNLKIIEQSGNHVSSLVNDILDLAKIKANKIKLSYQELNFAEFMNSIVSIVKIRAIEKNIELEYQSLGNLPTYFYADEKRLRQVLIHLLDNSIRFTNHGKVVLKTSAIAYFPPQPSSIASMAKQTIRFEIKDTGVGIARDEIAKIFRPFEQASNSKKHQGSIG
ncbi:hybrid sensor histidine kinase/response regulator [Pleurocapsa sp. CCALA 161]|uniref:ATP-binding protein n=1 Tax=Pleurocapsa sp. CCALA 161 TaxID=2107688 RepID=UPI000D05D777|nr:ATP-binding protein [Pleurocapsa sp. CCALA 161]PSB08024.1 hybrid sensor histidine kinase/response regulator [Pleurocapsa sp. CCALA 161]